MSKKVKKQNKTKLYWPPPTASSTKIILFRADGYLIAVKSWMGLFACLFIVKDDPGKTKGSFS